MQLPYIRLATNADLESINRIYNQAISAKLTAHKEEIKMDQRFEWFMNHPVKKSCNSNLFYENYDL